MRPLALILAFYLLLAVGYSVATPLFETPDEHLHYFTAEFIAREGRLPTTTDPGLMAQESAQPPLYYVLAAPIVRAFDPGGAGEELWVNPRVDTSAVAGQLWTSPLAPPNPRGESAARPPINANMFIHGPAEVWPWRGYALAAHLVRLLSVLFGLGTLLCIHAAARVVWPRQPDRALLATALVAFLPQFAFIHAAVSNDAAITFFCAAALWRLLHVTNGELRMTNEELAHKHSSFVIRRSSLVTLGLTIGLAMLSKAAGILLLGWSVGVVGLAVLLREYAAPPAGRRWARAWTRAVVAGALVAGPALLVAGWLLWRNLTLYGDATAANQFVALTGGYRPYTLLQVWNDMDRVWLSFFAIFGWMSVQPPAWIHLVWNGIVVLALVGGMRNHELGIRNPKPATRHSLLAALFSFLIRHSSFLILFGWFLLVAAGWLQFMLRTSADQGRLFFPALVPLALGTAWGLSRWPRPWPQLAAVTLALVTSAYCLVAVVPPAFAKSPPVAALPPDAAPLDYTFSEGLALLGARVETTEARPGDWVWTTLYWRAGPDLTFPPPFAHLELFGRGYRRIGEVVAYHGRGNDPATLWPEGALVADRLAARVTLDEDSAAPVLARVGVKLAEDADSRDVGVVKVVPAQWPERVEPLARLGEGIELAAADLSATTAAPGDSVVLRVGWQVAAPPGAADLHLFVHLGDPARQPLAQFDGPVMAGEYPARVWAAGEAFDETVTLGIPADLPPGDYPINLGLYDFATGARLPVVVDGERSATDTFRVGVVRVQ